MIYLITGKPGHGKTLYTITKIQERAKAENRQVYYVGIKDLKLDWVELKDGAEWCNPEVVPDGAIIVMDECQRVFPPRSTGSKVPPHVQPFDVHRHRGLDVYLITQDPMLIDSFVRNLVGEHRHVLRTFGAHSARVYHWDCVRDPDSRAERAASQQTDMFFYPKETFELYHSATHHTVKRKLPRVVTLAFPFLILAVFALGGISYYRYKQRVAGGKESVKQTNAVTDFKPGAVVPEISQDWRIVGYLKVGEKITVVLVGEDGRKRYTTMDKELKPDALDMAMKVDGVIVTKYSGKHDRKNRDEPDGKPKVGKL